LCNFGFGQFIGIRDFFSGLQIGAERKVGQQGVSGQKFKVAPIKHSRWALVSGSIGKFPITDELCILACDGLIVAGTKKSKATENKDKNPKKHDIDFEDRAEIVWMTRVYGRYPNKIIQHYLISTKPKPSCGYSPKPA
jgi:hypothetical protein